MLALTIDIDWSPDIIVDSVINLLEEAKIPATLYCTNPDSDHSKKSSCLAGKYSDLFELGLHPNFQYVTDYGAVLDSLLQQYPNATGFRSHNGCTGHPIWQEAKKRRLTYEVFCPIPHGYVAPFKLNKHESSYTALTTNFFDSKELYNPSFNWSIDSLPFKDQIMDDTSLIILGFHPNILYYDMQTMDEYSKLKEIYHHPEESLSYIHKKNLTGAMKLFTEIIDNFPKNKFQTVNNFIKEHQFS